MAKMGKNEAVSVDVLEKICKAVDCNLGDVAEFNLQSSSGRALICIVRIDQRLYLHETAHTPKINNKLYCAFCRRVIKSRQNQP